MRKFTLPFLLMSLAAVVVATTTLAYSPTAILILNPGETITVQCTGSNQQVNQNSPVEHFIECQGVASTPTIVPATSTPQPTSTPTTMPSPPPPSSDNRIHWQGQDWFLHGANAAWYNWAKDFGGGPDGGLSGEILHPDGSLNLNHTITQRFAQFPPADMHVVTWWMFQKDDDPTPYQILTDGQGRPTGVHPNVYADIDAALLMAEEFDLYFSFAVFDRPSHLPYSWLTTYRTDLVNALRPMFAAYGQHPRVFSWQPFVEPDWDIWGGLIDLETTQLFVGDFATAVHQESHALVTVNAAMVDALPHWKGLGLDYYSTSWYDYMNGNNPPHHNGGGGGWCALCSDYQTIKDVHGLDKPLIIGEFFGGPGATYIIPGVDGGPYERFEAWYNKGFAGALAWSVFPERTADGMEVDYAAATLFGLQHSDLGPLATGAPPPPPSPTPPGPTATPPSPTATPPPVPGDQRIHWQGQEWFLYGANAAWYNWARDFGGGPDQGLSGEIVNPDGSLKMDHPITQRFAQLPATEMHTISWWMFQSSPNDTPYQIQTANRGRPTSIHPNVYADIDAALLLAEEFDLYFSFAVFDRPSHIPNAWRTNQRADLMNALQPMFAAYGNHPRIISWQPFVEPDWDIWNGVADLSTTQAFVADFATAVHEVSHALVTVNAAMPDGLPNWKGLGLDYYSTSWYDYMNINNPIHHDGGGGAWCALCVDYQTLKARYDLDKPLVIGEYYVGPDATYLIPGVNGGPYERLQAWYNKGFAGILAWSLFPEKNQDGMQIDYGAAALFGAQHNDLGPTNQGN